MSSIGRQLSAAPQAAPASPNNTILKKVAGGEEIQTIASRLKTRTRDLIFQGEDKGRGASARHRPHPRSHPWTGPRRVVCQDARPHDTNQNWSRVGWLMSSGVKRVVQGIRGPIEPTIFGQDATLEQHLIIESREVSKRIDPCRSFLSRAHQTSYKEG